MFQGGQLPLQYMAMSPKYGMAMSVLVCKRSLSIMVMFFTCQIKIFFLSKAANSHSNEETRENQLSHLNELAPLSPLPSTVEDDEDKEEIADESQTTNYLSPTSGLTDSDKFLKFAERHRSVLNQILRQSTTHLSDGAFSVLVDHVKLLDFDVKRRYFRSD